MRSVCVLSSFSVYDMGLCSAADITVLHAVFLILSVLCFFHKVPTCHPRQKKTKYKFFYVYPLTLHPCQHVSVLITNTNMPNLNSSVSNQSMNVLKVFSSFYNKHGGFRNFTTDYDTAQPVLTSLEGLLGMSRVQVHIVVSAMQLGTMW